SQDLRQHHSLLGSLVWKITVDENDIRDQNVRHYREHIGVVGQEPVLFGTTIGNNIKFGRERVSEEEMEQAAKEANA
ncbi:ATP-binding cassette sub-family B member 5, partial [Lemmus lemmus]